MNPIIDIQIKRKIYTKKGKSLSLLDNFDLQVYPGERIAIIGESGAGKSTLLNIIGLLDSSFEGRYKLFDEAVQELSDKEKARIRNQRIGFVLQESALIQSLSIEQNIKLPLLYTDVKSDISNIGNFESIVKALGIEDILQKKPFECSGGEKSRAVFARAIIMNPTVILSDEPTASLDEKNSERLLQLLFEMNKREDTTLITVTHDLDVALKHDRVIRIERR